MPEIDKSLVISKVELLLSEKMASLAMLRTGIAVFSLPFSVLTVLIATSNFYEFSKVGVLLIVVYSLCAALAGIGGYMVYRSLKRIHILDQKIEKIKEHYKFMNHLMVE
ncbi:MAG: hypothetical protein Q7J68_05140 [Thermoplasmata archaeon]|nr:hypothetical protein [Thermoplasmata archaeon]